jgi:hypothetical protein
MVLAFFWIVCWISAKRELVKHFINYGQERIGFTLPKEWHLISAEDRPPIPGVSDPIREIRQALDHPFGSPRIEELARPGIPDKRISSFISI